MLFTITVRSGEYDGLIQRLEEEARGRLVHAGIGDSIFSHIIIAEDPNPSRLGYFISGEKVIVLSEELVENSDYTTVLNVFLHELAHALDHHMYASGGHGRTFRACCALLSIDPEFSKSRVNAKVSREKGRREKIRKLMALSSSPFENEASEAVKKAQALMLECRSQESGKKKIYTASIYEGKKIPSWINALSSYLSSVTGVFAIKVGHRDATSVELYGSVEEVELAVYIATYIMEAADREIAAERRKGEKIGVPAFMYAAITSLGSRTASGDVENKLIPVSLENRELAVSIVFKDKVIRRKRTQVCFRESGSFHKGESFGSSLDIPRKNPEKLITQVRT